MRRPVIGAVVVLLVTFVAPPAAAHAYALSGCRFATSTDVLKWQDATTRPDYAGPAADAVGVWNAEPIPLTLVKATSGANIRIADGVFGKTWHGMSFAGITLDTSERDPTIYACSGGTWDTTMVTWWNRSYTDPFPAEERQAIMIHELGHAFGLAHTFADLCGQATIMDADIVRWYTVCGLHAPKQDDINGINALY
jgi:hypothetical protein